VSEGTASLEAWRQVLGDQDIGSELQRYVAQDTLTGAMYRFTERITTAASAAVNVADSDVQAVLGDLLRRVASAPEAAARFDAAIALRPPSARARALYGLLLVEESNLAKARGLLLEASRDTRDWLVQYHAATGLTRLLSASDEAAPDLVAAARAAIDRVRTARPDLANVYALDARLQTAADEDPVVALESIRRARSISPGREDYVLLESFILMRLGRFAAARALASPLTGPASSAAVQSNARDILAQIGKLEQIALDYIATLEGRPPADSSVTGTGRLALRRLQPGEQRSEGTLARIDCAERGVVFEVNVGGAAQWFGAPSLSGVPLISHRDDLRGAITCGPRANPERVYVTWTPAEPPSTMRRAVAVEFLPK
jgi:tetratricopeptide (TPR) repeat protein